MMVDFPTFGFPIIFTNPDLCAIYFKMKYLKTGAKIVNKLVEKIRADRLELL
jgi:hypothetical protein